MMDGSDAILDAKWVLCGRMRTVRGGAFTRYPPPPLASGFSAPIKGYVQAGEATLCKKPYAVCDYPNGDVFVRHALQVWTCLFSCLCAVAAMMTATHRSHGLMSRKYKSESQTRNACRR